MSTFSCKAGDAVLRQVQEINKFERIFDFYGHAQGQKNPNAQSWGCFGLRYHPEVIRFPEFFENWGRIKNN
jgi:hypothetical protein